jgi:hypothetical protein
MRVNWKKLNREDRIEILKDGIRRGLSASQIAAEVEGCTKNAIIGLTAKTGIHLPSKWKPKEQPEAPPPPSKLDWSAMDLADRELFVKRGLRYGMKVREIAEEVENTSYKAVKSFIERMRHRDMLAAELAAVAIKAAPAKPVAAPEPIPSPKSGVNIMDLLDRQCRYPLWSDDEVPHPPEGFMFCGEETNPRTCFCGRHHSVVWVKPDQPMRYDRRHMRR